MFRVAGILACTLYVLLVARACLAEGAGAGISGRKGRVLARINSQPLSGPLIFAYLGDPKLSPVFAAMIQALNRDQRLAFVIIGGDLVHKPRRKQFKRFLEQLHQLHHPCLVLPGNHDTARGRRHRYQRIFGPSYFSFVRGNAKFILLDTSNEKDLGPEQERWLEQELADSQHLVHRLVFMHVPLHDPRPVSFFRRPHCLRDETAVSQLEALFRRYRVTLVFASHIHAFYHYAPGGLPTIISGGGGAHLKGPVPEHAFFHYVRITVGPDKVSTRVVRIAPGRKK